MEISTVRDHLCADQLCANQLCANEPVMCQISRLLDDSSSEYEPLIGWKSPPIFILVAHNWLLSQESWQYKKIKKKEDVDQKLVIVFE